MKKYIPLSVPNLKGNEMKYVSDAINSEWVSTVGEYVNNFENKITEYVGSAGAVSCQNGTAGIHLALIVLGVKKNHEVIVPTLTFIAAVNPIKYIDANPIFMDCDESLGIDPIKLESFIQEECVFKDGKLYNKFTSKHISAMVIVHVFGNMADMEKLMPIAKKYNIKVIEDSTEALGTYYTEGKFENMFAGTIGDIGVYSFNGNKIITTGGGGMIVSNNQSYLYKLKHLSTQAKSDKLYFLHDEIGYNYRMTNIQAALGIAQLEQLESFISIKKSNYLRYKEAFEQSGNFNLINFRKNTRPNYWFYSLYKKNASPDIPNFIKHMHENKIQVRPIWGLIHKQKPYTKYQYYMIDKAINYVSSIVNIPCSSNLSEDEVDFVVSKIYENRGDF